MNSPKDKKILTLNGFKLPSKKFKEMLNNNRYYIIQGEKDSGKTTIANTLHFYFKNSIAFSFKKNENINMSFCINLEKNLNLNYCIYKYNYSICDYMS